ncbi:MAG: alkaline phosphatase family protein, partial [Sphingomonadales bacterium]|nr:alkaline phosphatase family protein [Sphingomonadales bacterium]
MKTALFAGIALLAGAVPGAALAEPVLFISIDGLRPGDVIEAEQRGLTLPHLRRFIAEGSYASGVIGNLPTVTYPSHTTLMTGVAPARHGVVNNTTFDPIQINQSGWYWYATDITVPTLWDAAATAGFSTANVHWPVSVNAKSVTWNLPQIWRTGHGDDAKLLKALATPGLVDDLEGHHGPYAAGIDESLNGDINRAAFAASLIAAKKPHFITVYLTALDHEQH